MRMLAVGALALVAASSGVAGRQQGAPAADAQARFGTRTEAVLVDVSVTDRKGRPVTDLTQSDFQVFEDGNPQEILTFSRHQPNSGASPADAGRAAGLVTGAAHAHADAPSQRGPSVAALAFDRLSPDGRMLAYQAAKQVVKDKQPDELAGVFMVDQSLGILAPYTSDTATLDKAIDRAATMATTRLARSERNPELSQFYSSPDVPWVAGASVSLSRTRLAMTKRTTPSCAPAASMNAVGTMHSTVKKSR